MRLTTTSPSITRFDTSVHRSLGCCLMMFRHILQILSPSIVSWLLWSSIKLHMQMLKLSASTTLILTNGEIESWWPRVSWDASGSRAGADKLSLNFSVMALRCFKHLTHCFLGCFKPNSMTKFSLSESSRAWSWSQLLTIPCLVLIRIFKKTGCKREEFKA